MKQVFLTGATGFIGSHAVAKLLAQGCEIHAPFIGDVPEPRDGVHWYPVDFFDTRAISSLIRQVRPSHFLHFAWIATPGRYWTSLENPTWTRTSIDALQTFISAGGRRFVIAGTCAEYDWSGGECDEETTPLKPSTLYGASKHALQVVATALSRASGVSGAWGRVFMLYGPREHPARLVPQTILSLLKGEPALSGPGEQTRDLLHVEDVASAFVALLESDVQGPVNIGSGSPVTLRDVVSRIGKLMSAPELLKIGGRPGNPADPTTLIPCVARLQKEVGWQSTISIDAGLAQTIEYWKAHCLEER